MGKRGTYAGSYQVDAYVERCVRIMIRLTIENFTVIITATCT